MIRRPAISAIAMVWCFTIAPLSATAATPPTGLDLSRGCAIVDKSAATSLLGFDVQAPDVTTTTGGICTFPSTAVTHDGVVSYSIVTAADITGRAGYFRALAVRCRNVDPRAPNAAQCGTFRKLAFATTPADYYAARTSAPGTTAVTGLGDAAASTAIAVYVLRGGEVFECVVRRDELLDLDRSTALATLLLSRVPRIDAPPIPAASSTP